MKLDSLEVKSSEGVEFARRATGSKYDKLIEAACKLGPKQMIPIQLEANEDLTQAQRNLRNPLTRHNKQVKKTGNGVLLGLKTLDGGKALAVVAKPVPAPEKEVKQGKAAS